MRLTQSMMITEKLAGLAILSVVCGGGVVMALSASPAASKAPAPAATTTTIADTTPPPAPDLGAKPDNPTTGRNAHFRITDAETSVTFRCRLDGGAYGTCASIVNFNKLDFGEHCFDVRAADPASNLSAVTTWCWSIILQGGFPISGTIPERFAPGVTRPLNLVIGNPYSFTIRVTSVTVTVGDDTSDPGCDGSTNFTVTKGLTATVDIPRNSTWSLQQLGVAPAAWPAVTMPNLASNQDACKGATFSLAYTGQAVKP